MLIGPGDFRQDDVTSECHEHPSTVIASEAKAIPAVTHLRIQIASLRLANDEALASGAAMVKLAPPHGP